MAAPALAEAGDATKGKAGFTYLPAMQQAKIRRHAKSLDAFLTKPNGLFPGNRMAFAGVPLSADRANLIAYLASATK
jgi:cytochrome c